MNRSAVIKNILIERLKICYYPEWIFSNFSLKKVLKYQPISTYLSDWDRQGGFNADYDYGRVRYFINQIYTGKEFDPIIIESQKEDWCPIVTDGHHRYIASVLTNQIKIPAIFSGWPEVLDWLSCDD